ncbi:hypothetical protein QFC20_004398 [Naganishia adeliensis]|uniref:Uncharacterized protein n=1 Tax=Naganishia adeliensis TaxID=92952 RepID=A0ACC2W147_9TREE|nr:hypothetical protein QFC20_004398 [Naganishia adeliensis]
MGKAKNNRLYVTHTEHAEGLSAGSIGKRVTHNFGFQRLPFDCCALSLQPFTNPVAAITEGTDGSPPRADVFDLLNIVPYIRKYHTNPVTGAPLETTDLIKLNFHRNPEGNLADWVTYKPFSQHTHIVFLRNTDPENLGARDLKNYDYIKSDKKVEEDDQASNPLKGINVDAAGGAGKVLRMVAEKSRQAALQQTEKKDTTPEDEGKPKEGVVAERKRANNIYNASNFTTGQAAASLTSTALAPTTKNDKALFDEVGDCVYNPSADMFDEMSKYTKEKERLRAKGYATIQTNYGNLNVELHGDRAPKTVFNWIKLAKQGKYDDVIFHRLIPGFMIQGGDPTGTGSGGTSYWGSNFRDETDIKGAYKHDSRGVMSMANRGPNTNGSQFFFTFRATPHLDGKHTVFGKLIDSDTVLSALESLPSHKGTDRPLEDIKILGITVVQDPFEIYEERLKAKLSRQDQSEEALAVRAAKKAKRDQDRTTWLGTNLEDKEAKRKRGVDGEEVAVGKYLAAKKAVGTSEVVPTGAYNFGGQEKKQKKTGGFGDFSGW